MTPMMKRPWHNAGALVVTVAALMAAPNLISQALPPVSEAVETKEVTLGTEDNTVHLEGTTCRVAPLNMMETYACGDAEIATITVDTTDDPDLLLQRMVRAAHSAQMPDEQPITKGNVRVLQLDEQEAKDMGLYDLDEGEHVTGMAIEQGDKTIVAVVTGDEALTADVMGHMQEATR